jgi:hypothetical protein
MENPDIEQIIAECKRKTRISYRDDGSFFNPRMLSLNHLQLGNSKILRNPLLLLAEWVYRQYMRVRDAWKAFKTWLFPRRARLWCDRADSALVGQINYADRYELNVPIHNLKVEIWGRTYWGQWRKLAEGHSDYDGRFSLPYELRQARNWQMRTLQFEVYQTTHAYFGAKEPRTVLETCHVEQVPISNLTGMRYNLRTIHLALWEYRRDTKVPRTVIRNVDSDSPQYYAQGRVDALYRQIMPLELIKAKHLAQIAEAPETISLAEIQRDYPLNLTVCIEKHLPGYTRGDEWFGRRMMNGMNRGTFMPDAAHPGHYWVKYFGVCGYDRNEEYALPDVEIKFAIEGDNLPLPIEIHLTGQTNAFDKDPWQKKVFTPASGDDWLYAKRIARVNGAFNTEVEEHFTGTHLNTEQYAIAAYRNFRLSPLACLLFPHVKEVALVNHSADTLLIHSFIPTATALTENGLLHRCYDLLGMQDWKGWRPMRPINAAHTCARAEQMFWDLVVEYVDRFFGQHEAEIKHHWGEVLRFSNDLVNHAVPVFLSDTDLDRLSPNERRQAEARLEYYSLQYAFDHNAPRQTVNGELKAVSPITTAHHFEQAANGDWDNLKQACAYIIMMATYMHTWINEHQYDDLGEVLYSSGGLRFGNKERGILAPESDLSISPDLTRSTQTLWFTNFLSRTEYGFITKNEEGDVNPLFIQMLLDKKDDFAKLGVDVHAIESRTNI